MKVKITHTIDHEDVPSFVEELLKKCKDQLNAAAGLKFNAHDLKSTREEIQRVQDSLELIMTQLDDCYHIYTGYKEMLSQAEPSPLPTLSEKTEEEKLKTTIKGDLVHVPSGVTLFTNDKDGNTSKIMKLSRPASLLVTEINESTYVVLHERESWLVRKNKTYEVSNND